MGSDLIVCRFDERSKWQLCTFFGVEIVLIPRQSTAFPRSTQGNARESQAIEHGYRHQNDQHKANDHLLSFRQLQVEVLSFHVSLWWLILAPCPWIGFPTTGIMEVEDPGLA